MFEISKPTQKTWYIIEPIGGDVLYGAVETNQVMSTGHEIVETFLSEDAWLAALTEKGIELDENI